MFYPLTKIPSYHYSSVAFPLINCYVFVTHRPLLTKNSY